MPPPVFAPLGFSVSAEQKLELLEYWRSIVKRKWAILGLAFIVAVLASVVAYALTPIYKSTATVLIEAGKAKVLSIEEVYSAGQQREHYQTQVEILKSREVAERVVKVLKLHEHREFDPRQASAGWRQRISQTLGMGEAKDQWTEAEAIESATKAVMADTAVDPVRLSQLVRVSFESADAALAARVANALAAEYIDADRDSRFKLTQEVSTFLQERLSDLRAKLMQSEQALQAYREQKGIVSLGGSAQAVTSRQIDETSQRLAEARSRRAQLETAYELARSVAPANYAEIPAVGRDPIVSDTLRQRNAVLRNLQVLQETLGEEHYRVIQAQGELVELNRILKVQSETVVASLRREFEGARDTQTALERVLGAATGNVQSVNREEFQLSVLEREAASNRQIFEMFMSRAKETNLAGDVQAAVARVVDKAVTPSVPVRPAKFQIVVVAAVLALFAGAMAALLLDRLDNTLKGGDDAEQRLQLPVLTALPMLDGHDRPHMARVFIDESHSHYAEGIRTARTGVLLSNLDVPHKILLITSTLPGEGKTTVSVNLALAHAQTKTTLLIDADMRRSQVARALGITGGVKGLTNLVAGDASIDECLVSLKDTNLLVLPVGDLPPNPLELLLSQRFKDVLAQLSERFEMVIIDSPPVELVSEALVLAPMATSIAFVVKAMSTPAPLARKSIMRLQRAGGNILGLVVNQLDFDRAQRYYGEYGGSYGSYGGYGTYNAAPQIGAAKGAKPAPVAQDAA
jgi:polysaccharide biosynthesis transport protein